MQEVNLIGVLSTGGYLPVIEPKTITANGTYNVPSGVDGFNPVVVNVPSQEPNIQERVFASNGTFEPPEGVDGYAPVIIDVPMKEEITLNATTNGTYTPSEGRVYNNVIVNVPIPQNAYLLKSVANLPQAIASFNDGEEMVMSSLKVAIEPQQEGSGDPSPTNIRPISGWDKCNVGVVGKNLCKSTVHGYVSSSDDLIIIDNDTESAIFYAYEGQTYTISSSSTMNKSRVALVGTDNVVNYTPLLQREILSDNVNTWTATWTGWTVWYKCSSRQTAFDNSTQVELGSTATAYEPYNGQTYTIDLDGTRYGGEVDIVNGIVTPAPYYASYNGETLTGEWISDRDKYEVGATPTIGAQVVNIGASGTPVSILSTAVKSLRGVNNVYTNTGNVKDAEYFSKEV